MRASCPLLCVETKAVYHTPERLIARHSIRNSKRSRRSFTTATSLPRCSIDQERTTALAQSFPMIAGRLTLSGVRLGISDSFRWSICYGAPLSPVAHRIGTIYPFSAALQGFIKVRISGDPPWNGDKHFLECADGPVKPYTAGKLRSLRQAAKWATLIGRFYRRN
jgi:hypothetical protein